MIGLGTIINTLAIVGGGILGLLFGSSISDRMQDGLCKSCGVATLFLGMAGALEGMFTLTDSGVSAGGTMLLIGCLCFGTAVGEAVNLEDAIERFGAWLKVRTGNAGDAGFIDGFVTASLTVCIGAMAIVGALQDGLLGDYSTLAAKGVLDFIIVMVMTASMGKGCVFSAIPVAILQGSVTALSGLLRPVMTDAALANISTVGSVLIFCVGVNLVFGKKLRVANMLPGVIFAVIAAFL